MPKNIEHVPEKRDHPSSHKFTSSLFFDFPLPKQWLEKPKNIATEKGTKSHWHPSLVKIQIKNKQQSTLRPSQL